MLKDREIIGYCSVNKINLQIVEMLNIVKNEIQEVLMVHSLNLRVASKDVSNQKARKGD